MSSDGDLTRQAAGEDVDTLDDDAAEMEVGSLVWIDATPGLELVPPEIVLKQPTHECYVRAKVTAAGEDMLTVKTEGINGAASGVTVTVPRQLCSPADGGSVISDNLMLPTLNEASLVHNLRVRFESGCIYTDMGGLELLAFNPYERTKLTASEEMSRCRDGTESEPHVWKLAERIYSALGDDKVGAQSVIVSGESGAGKTEVNKLVVQYLRWRSSDGATAGARTPELSDGMFERAERAGVISSVVSASNVLLEALGNATTPHNHNSSRFSKYLELAFSPHGSMCGARFQTFLLEKGRVARQCAGERNFHAFYMLCRAPDEVRTPLGVRSAAEHDYTATCTERGGAADAQDDGSAFGAFDLSLREATSPADASDLYGVLAALLHLGDVCFVAGREEEGVSTTVAPGKGLAALTAAASILGLPAEGLLEHLTLRWITAGADDEICIPMPPSEAARLRDAVAEAIYQRLFLLTVQRLNGKLTPSSLDPFADGPSSAGRASLVRRMSLSAGAPAAAAGTGEKIVGLLDLFGFESLRENGFEQLCINFANEKLHHLFVTSQVFRGLPPEDFDLLLEGDTADIDNAGCLALLSEPPSGLLHLLDVQCEAPQASEETFLLAVSQQHGGGVSEYLTTADGDESMSRGFVVRHYAGDVLYSAGSFLQLNNDSTSGLRWLARDVGNPLVRRLFSDADLQPHASSSSSSSRSASFISVGNRFASELSELFSTLQATEISYVRCMKPNLQMKPKLFEPSTVRDSLRAAGTLTALSFTRILMPGAAAAMASSAAPPAGTEAQRRRHEAEAVQVEATRLHQELASAIQSGATAIEEEVVALEQNAKADTSAAMSEAEAKYAQVLTWCREVTKGYPGIELGTSNDLAAFSTPWSDGRAFCALMHHYFPYKIGPFEELADGSTDGRRMSLMELAFSVASEAGIPEFLNAEDMEGEYPEPDPKPIFLYVSRIFQTLKDAAPELEPPPLQPPTADPFADSDLFGGGNDPFGAPPAGFGSVSPVDLTDNPPPVVPSAPSVTSTPPGVAGGLSTSQEALNAEARQRTQAVFSKYDADCNGLIDGKELDGALRELGLDTTTDDVSRTLKRYDKDGNSGLDIAEFLGLVSDVLRVQRNAARILVNAAEGVDIDHLSDGLAVAAKGGGGGKVSAVGAAGAAGAAGAVAVSAAHMTAVAGREAAHMTAVAAKEAARVGVPAAKAAAHQAAVASKEAAHMTAVAAKEAARVGVPMAKAAAHQAAVKGKEAAHLTAEAAKEAARIGVPMAKAAAHRAAEGAKEAARVGVPAARAAAKEAAHQTAVAYKEAKRVGIPIAKAAAREAAHHTKVAYKEAKRVGIPAAKQAAHQTKLASKLAYKEAKRVGIPAAKQAAHLTHEAAKEAARVGVPAAKAAAKATLAAAAAAAVATAVTAKVAYARYKADPLQKIANANWLAVASKEYSFYKETLKAPPTKAIAGPSPGVAAAAGADAEALATSAAAAQHENKKLRAMLRDAKNDLATMQDMVTFLMQDKHDLVVDKKSLTADVTALQDKVTVMKRETEVAVSFERAKFEAMIESELAEKEKLKHALRVATNEDKEAEAEMQSLREALQLATGAAKDAAAKSGGAEGGGSTEGSSAEAEPGKHRHRRKIRRRVRKPSEGGGGGGSVPDDEYEYAYSATDAGDAASAGSGDKHEGSREHRHRHHHRHHHHHTEAAAQDGAAEATKQSGEHRGHHHHRHHHDV